MQVEYDPRPCYELVISLLAFLDNKGNKITDLGPKWLKSVTKQVPDGYGERYRKLSPLPLVLCRLSPARTAEDFLTWFAGLSKQEIITLLLPRDEKGQLSRLDVDELHQQWLEGLNIWQRVYFSKVDPEILAQLTADAQERSRQDWTSEEQIERATNGVTLEWPGLERVVLVPQYHYSPWNLNDWGAGEYCIYYPVDVASTDLASPAPALLRGGRALADENRLRILRFLGAGTRTFTDVVKFIGLAKSTVHHHMVILRASGLVRAHVTPDNDRYSLRPGGMLRLAEQFERFFEGDS
ncbi:MAG: winged helix-turn-helix transcriptional regulator [Firmicutes bacterium]|nr:winged helix-turn-helix transcriptional regulator [Bacillota bacterium]